MKRVLQNLFFKLNRDIRHPLLVLMAVCFAISLLIVQKDVALLSSFWSVESLKIMALHATISGIAALGVCVVIIGGGIDLSSGSLIALSSVSTALVLSYGAGTDQSISFAWCVLACAASLLLCASMGACNGLLASFFRVPSVLITLGTMQFIRGLAEYMSGNVMVRTPENPLQLLMSTDSSFGELMFPLGVWLMLFLTAVLTVILKWTPFGRYLYAMGADAQEVQRCGVSLTRIRCTAFAFSGALCGMAGILHYSRLGSGSPHETTGFGLDVIAAVVIGGGSLKGGRASALGAMMGALVLSVLRSGLIFLDIPGSVQEIMLGSILLLSLGTARRRH